MKIDMTPHGLSVQKYNTNNPKTRIVLYENIPTLEDAYLLAQYAMSQKHDNELIIIMPGWNKGIKDDKGLYNRASKLAKKYKANITCI